MYGVQARKSPFGRGAQTTPVVMAAALSLLLATIIPTCIGLTTSGHHSHAHSHPHQASGSDQPHQAFGSGQPHQTPASNQPHQASGPDQPHQAFGSGQPHQTPASNQPHQASGPDQPHQAFGSGQPHQTPASNQPHQASGSDQPHQASGPDQPHQTPASNQPHQASGPDQPLPQAPNNPVVPQKQDQPSSGAGSDLTSNAAKIIATGALTGAAAMASQQALNRPTRHLGSAPKTFVDLSHPLHNGTLHWPTMGDVQYSILVDGERTNKQGQSYYLKADALNVSIHSGTHLDAPRHFSKTGWTVEQIPLDRLIDVPLTVIDVSEKVKADRSYNVVKADFLNSNTGEPLVQPNSVVLIYTGVSQAYDQGKEAYLGTASQNISEMKVPGLSEEAAKFLVERGIYGVGLDSISADSSVRHGHDGIDSFDPVAHVVLNSNNIYILENVSKKLSELVDVQGARLTIAPLPIVGGSGSQVRLVAIIGHDECHCDHQGQQQQQHNSTPNGNAHSSLTILITLLAVCLAIFLI